MDTGELFLDELPAVGVLTVHVQRHPPFQLIPRQRPAFLFDSPRDVPQSELMRAIFSAGVIASTARR
jgi:hypothetical protein